MVVIVCVDWLVIVRSSTTWYPHHMGRSGSTRWRPQIRTPRIEFGRKSEPIARHPSHVIRSAPSTRPRRHTQPWSETNNRPLDDDDEEEEEGSERRAKRLTAGSASLAPPLTRSSAVATLAAAFACSHGNAVDSATHHTPESTAAPPPPPRQLHPFDRGGVVEQSVDRGNHCQVTRTSSPIRLWRLRAE